MIECLQTDGAVRREGLRSSNEMKRVSRVRAQGNDSINAVSCSAQSDAVACDTRVEGEGEPRGLRNRTSKT